MNLRYEQLMGSEINGAIEQLGALRIAVFRDFPYLYEGSMEYERDYLHRYASHKDAFVFLVYDGEQLVGATTCMPLQNEYPEIQQPFIDNGISVAEIMYFGESILLPAYRGLRIGHRFFDEREKYTRLLGRFKTMAFCSVVRPDNHPLKPGDYHSNDVFWDKRGYVLAPNLVCLLAWKDLNEIEETEKSLAFRLKQLV